MNLSIPSRLSGRGGLNTSTTLGRWCFAALLTAWLLGTQAVQGQDIFFTTSLQSLNLTGPPIPLPIVPDAMGGWATTPATVTITLSSSRSPNPGQASTGLAYSISNLISATFDPDMLDGQVLAMHANFDVFFDLKVTPELGPEMNFPDQGPAHMEAGVRQNSEGLVFCSFF